MKNYKKLLTVLTLTTLTLTSCGNKNEEKNSNNSNPVSYTHLGVMQMRDVSQFGRVAIRTLVLYLITTAPVSYTHLYFFKNKLRCNNR